MSVEKESNTMTSMSVRTLALTAALAVFTAIPALAATAKVVCMTDDGYGRLRPCSAGFKQDNPNWRGSDACMTDEGGGRMKPCDADYKKKHSK